MPKKTMIKSSIHYVVSQVDILEDDKTGKEIPLKTDDQEKPK